MILRLEAVSLSRSLFADQTTTVGSMGCPPHIWYRGEAAVASGPSEFLTPKDFAGNKDEVSEKSSLKLVVFVDRLSVFRRGARFLNSHLTAFLKEGCSIKDNFACEPLLSNFGQKLRTQPG